MLLFCASVVQWKLGLPTFLGLKQVGPFGTLVYAGHDWADVALSRRSMELMARAEMPAVNAAIGEIA